MKLKLLHRVLIGAVLMVGVAVALMLWRLMAIDECLDHGGTWWAKENKCSIPAPAHAPGSATTLKKSADRDRAS